MLTLALLRSDIWTASPELVGDFIGIRSQMEGGGLHRPTDNLARVVTARLREGVEVLARVLEKYDARELVFAGQDSNLRIR